MPTLPTSQYNNSTNTAKVNTHQNRMISEIIACDVTIYVCNRPGASICVAKMASEGGEVNLYMGHRGAGDNCLDRTAVYAMNGAVAGM